LLLSLLDLLLAELVDHLFFEVIPNFEIQSFAFRDFVVERIPPVHHVGPQYVLVVSKHAKVVWALLLKLVITASLFTKLYCGVLILDQPDVKGQESCYYQPKHAC
jgi:hypothetical protein